ncbi:MAG: PadR family transcriptional regulator [Actinomycetota bacterium]
MIETAILGLLKDRSMHGYELKKELTAQLGQLWQFSYGNLYPTIARLQKSGAVERVFPKEDVKRRKNIYRITAKGEEVFNESMAEHSVDDARFSMKLAFFRYLKPVDRVDVLERRRAYLTDKLFETKTKLRAYRERIDAYTYRLMEHGADRTSADIEWIDKLIAEEKDLRRNTT